MDDDERLKELREKLQTEHHKEEARREHELAEKQRHAMEHLKIFLLILGVILMGLLVMKWFPLMR